MSRPTVFGLRRATARAARACLAASLSIIAAGCSGEPTGAGDKVPFTAFDFTFTEAAGDTINPSATASGRATDLSGISGTVNGEFVVVTLTFAQPVQPWSSGATNALDGFVDFDMDENAATGIPAAVDEYGGTSGVGAEAYLSLRDDGAGHLAVRDVSTGEFGIVNATFTATSVTARIPKGYLRAPLAEQFRVAAVVGNRDRPATDFAPDDGYFRIAR